MYDAIVLAGGSARRLGGADKPMQDVGGSALLERVLAAAAGATRRVVVGPRRHITPDVIWRREQPPGGGPVAAIAAALDDIAADRVVVLAADLPAIAPAVPALLAALDASAPAVGVACLADPGGHINYLAAAWRTPVLRQAIAAVGDPDGVPVRALVAAATMIEVVDPAGWGRDCDTWEDLAEARDSARAQARAELERGNT